MPALPPPGVPERRRSAGSLVSMDAAMLAAQTERLDTLNQSIQELAKAVDTRPTREELDHQKKRNRLKAMASAFLVFLFGLGLFAQQQSLNRAQDRFENSAFTICEDRNNNNQALVSLLAAISRIQASNTDTFSEADRAAYSAAFEAYSQTLTPINCQLYLQQ